MSAPNPEKIDPRAAIAEAAGKILAAEGIGALTARRLAAAGGCSVGTLYNLFGDLDGVVRAVNRTSMAQLYVHLERTEGQDCTARLLALAEAYRAFALAEPNRWEALFRHRLTPPGPKAPAVEPEAAQLFALLRDRAGPGFDDDALTALWAAVHGVVELAVNKRLIGADIGAEPRYLKLVVLGLVSALGSEQAER
ncbi:MAG: TetR/AcrR family transcriptional regulator [Pseudomonadota bacterium]